MQKMAIGVLDQKYIYIYLFIYSIIDHTQQVTLKRFLDD
jgi:hypothetical protein